MADHETLPSSGLLTFCLTDIEGSVALWDADRGKMAGEVAVHEEVIASVVRDNAGHLCLTQGEGDATMSLFVRPADAVRAAIAIQERLARAVTLKVRIAVHTGEAERRGAAYYGPALNRTARLRSLAAGGQTFVSHITAELVADDLPAGATLRPLGAVQLRGLARAEEPYEVRMGRPGDPAPTLQGRSSLPVVLSSFVGRDDEQARLRQMLGSARLVTVTGAGGAGKTRLATEVVQRQLVSGPVWLVDLAPLRDPQLVVETIAARLGVVTDVAEEPLEGLLRLLRRRDGGVLVLDNCEHLIQVCASTVRAVLSGCPEVTILATSQRPLGVAGEHVLRLGPLPAGDGVRLLEDRAADHGAAGGDAAVLATIVERLDGIPLALELAAAHLPTLSATELLARLDDDRFRLLAGAGSDSRHQTLAAAMDWSVGLLSDEAALLLQRLAIFGGGFTLAALEAICADERIRSDEVYALLAELVNASLVVVEGRDGDMRYRLLETVREYATHRLAASSEVLTWTVRREGETWAVTSGVEVARFRDSTGLRHLAALLGQPGTGVHVLDLSGGGVLEVGDAILDAPARAAYRRRLEELDADLDEARAAHDEGMVGRLEAERDTLTDELTAASALGGRARRTATAADRARVSVTKALRSAIARISAESPAIGAHLDAAVRTGLVCVYDPNDGRVVTLQP